MGGGITIRGQRVLWDAAEPGQGYAEKAAEWRATLDERGRSKPRSDEATTGKAGALETPNSETPK